MRFVSWNCNGALRKKFERLIVFQADIYIIQECEDPERTSDTKYKAWAQNYLWIGTNKNKGLGVFASPMIKLEKLMWSNVFEGHEVNFFLPCLINSEFQLLAVWAHHNNSPTFGYIGQFWKYLNTNFHKFDNILIGGDLNSNAVWDKWDRWWNHSDVLTLLQQKEISSLYHLFFNEKQGEESIPTFYLQRNPRKPYHIDYFFGSPIFQKDFHLNIGKIEEWLEISDHVPVIFDMKNK
jgi:exonuclease III